MGTVRSHYNPSNQLCAVEFSPISAPGSHSTEVDAAFEGRELGWTYDLNFKMGHCHVLEPQGKQIDCRDGSEFDQLTDRFYMNPQ